jgi:hypothetical protein
MRKKSERQVLTEAGFHPPLLLKPLGDLLETRRVVFLIGSRVLLGDRRYGRTGVLRDTYQATISTARTEAPKLKVGSMEVSSVNPLCFEASSPT